MKARLYVFIGPSGAGKSSVARAAVGVCPQEFARVVKKTTRDLREDDDDVQQVQSVDLRGNEKYVAYLTNGGVTYLIDLEEVKNKLDQGISQIVIVNNPMTIKILERILGNAVRVIFVHRDLNNDDLRSILVNRGLSETKAQIEVAKRMNIRTALYHQLASGVLRVDHVIINTTIQESIQQFFRLHSSTKEAENSGGNTPILNIIVAGSGSGKDTLLRLVESIPGGSRFIVPKYLTREKKGNDGCETVHVSQIPAGCLSYHFFGNEYGVNPKEVVKKVRQTGLGFVTVANIPVARVLGDKVKEVGMRARIVYLHQAKPDLSSYKPAEACQRLEHLWQVFQLYREELIEEPGLSVVLAENDDVLCAYAQRMCMEASNVGE